MNEIDFKRWLRSSWSGWLESYEPRAGGGIGIPDIQILVSGRVLPIELKVGKLKSGRIYPNEVRPVQIAWHRTFADAGGVSAMLIGISNLSKIKWIPALINGRRMSDWKKGYSIGECLELSGEPEKMKEQVSFWLKENLLS